MKQINLLKRGLAVLLVGLLSCAIATAQAYKMNVDKPKVNDILSPDNAGSIANKKFKQKKWMEIEVKFKVDVSAKDREKIKFLDTVEVKWYLAMKHPEGKGLILLEKEITHVNVPVGEDIYTSIYLSPSAVKRLTGGDSVQKSDIEQVGGEIRINGRTIPKGKGYFSLNKQIRGSNDIWWNSGKLSRYDKVPLLNKYETPFKNFWWDRYAEIEEKK